MPPVLTQAKTSAQPATGTQPRARLNPLNPLTAWHLLSLDAPTVATLWTAFFARTSHTALPPALLPAMFLAVWLLYAADRLLDARTPGRIPPEAPLEARHYFHQRHARALRAAIFLVALTLIPLVLTLPRRDLVLYIALAILLAAWFTLVHVLAPSRVLPKELAAASFFAAAVTIPTHILPLLTVCFAILCALNLFLISHWERPGKMLRSTPTELFAKAEPGTKRLNWSATLRVALPASILFPLTLIQLEPSQTRALVALSLAASALAILHLTRRRICRTELRALADFALLTPLLLWPWLPHA